jgi:hypothetical protein
MKSFEPFAIVFLRNNSEYRVGVIPSSKIREDIPDSFKIEIESVLKGVIYFADDKWISYDIEDEALVQLLGRCIQQVYQKKAEILELTSENNFSLN